MLSNSLKHRHHEVNSHSYTVIAYLDTVEYALGWHLEAWQLRQLRKLHPNMKIKSAPEKASFAWRLTIQQPCREALLFLAEVRDDQISTVRADVACDFFPVSAKWLEKNLVQKWHGKRNCHPEDENTYIGGIQTNRNILPYSDKPSKVNGEPCFHIDFRFGGKKTLSSASLLNIEDQIQHPDITHLLQHQSKLMHLDERKLDIFFEEKARRIKRNSKTKMKVSTIKRRLEGDYLKILWNRASTERKQVSFKSLFDVPSQYINDYLPSLKTCLVETCKWSDVVSDVEYRLLQSD